MLGNQSFISHSPEQTTSIGYTFGKSLPLNSVVCFFGDLAAGKTTFIKGLVSGANGISPNHVNSPTFVYLNIYEGQKPVYHFDLYRLRDADEFLSMGFDEMFSREGICCIEWSEKIPDLIPPEAIVVKLQHAGEDVRHIEISGNIKISGKKV